MITIEEYVLNHSLKNNMVIFETTNNTRSQTLFKMLKGGILNGFIHQPY